MGAPTSYSCWEEEEKGSFSSFETSRYLSNNALPSQTTKDGENQGLSTYGGGVYPEPRTSQTRRDTRE